MIKTKHWAPLFVTQDVASDGNPYTYLNVRANDGSCHYRWSWGRPEELEVLKGTEPSDKLKQAIGRVDARWRPQTWEDFLGLGWHPPDCSIREYDTSPCGSVMVVSVMCLSPYLEFSLENGDVATLELHGDYGVDPSDLEPFVQRLVTEQRCGFSPTPLGVHGLYGYESEDLNLFWWPSYKDMKTLVGDLVTETGSDADQCERALAMAIPLNPPKSTRILAGWVLLDVASNSGHCLKVLVLKSRWETFRTRWRLSLMVRETWQGDHVRCDLYTNDVPTHLVFEKSADTDQFWIRDASVNPMLLADFLVWDSGAEQEFSLFLRQAQAELYPGGCPTETDSRDVAKCMSKAVKALAVHKGDATASCGVDGEFLDMGQEVNYPLTEDICFQSWGDNPYFITACHRLLGPDSSPGAFYPIGSDSITIFPCITDFSHDSPGDSSMSNYVCHYHSEGWTTDDTVDLFGYPATLNPEERGKGKVFIDSEGNGYDPVSGRLLRIQLCEG